MADPIEEDLRRARRSREALYRQIMNEPEEKPKDSSSSGTLKGKPIRRVDTPDKNIDKVFNRATKKSG